MKYLYLLPIAFIAVLIYLVGSILHTNTPVGGGVNSLKIDNKPIVFETFEERDLTLEIINKAIKDGVIKEIKNPKGNFLKAYITEAKAKIKPNAKEVFTVSGKSITKTEILNKVLTQSL